MLNAFKLVLISNGIISFIIFLVIFLIVILDKIIDHNKYSNIFSVILFSIVACGFISIIITQLLLYYKLFGCI